MNIKKEKILLYLVFALATFLILFHYTDTPQVWVDEGLFTETARVFATHGVLGIQTQPGTYFPMNNFLLSVSYPVIVPVALSLKLFGMGIWQARLPMVIYMFLLVLFFYLFTKRKYGFYNAILSVFLLLSFSPFYGNGRPVQGEVPGLAFLVLGSWLLLLFEESDFKNRKWAILSGIAYGLSASTKPIFLLGVTGALVIMLILAYRKTRERKTLVVFGLGYLLPVFLWMSIHLPTIQEILNFIPNVLYFGGTHSSGIPLSQTILTNSLKFVTESTPILFLFLVAVILFSFVVTFMKKEYKTYSLAEYVVLSFILLNWVGYVCGTGWYRYFFPANTLLYLLFPVAITITMNFFKNKFLRKVIMVIPIVLILFQFVHLSFFSDTNFTVTRMRNPDIAKVFENVDLKNKVLFNGASEANIFFKGENYAQFLRMGGFLDTGNERAFTDPSFDNIFSAGDLQETYPKIITTKCWTKVPVSKYFFFTKIKSCR